jgi:hypothetical protein
MQKFLAPVLLVFPVLGGVGTGAVLAAARNNPHGTLERHQPIVKVEEGCGNGYFRDGYGNSLMFVVNVFPRAPTIPAQAAKEYDR